jgi:hypothetical protein
MLKKAVSKATERMKNLTGKNRKKGAKTGMNKSKENSNMKNKKPSLNSKKKVTIKTDSQMKSNNQSITPTKSVKSILKKSVIVDNPIDIEMKQIDPPKPMTSKEAIKQNSI